MSSMLASMEIASVMHFGMRVIVTFVYVESSTIWHFLVCGGSSSMNISGDMMLTGMIVVMFVTMVMIPSMMFVTMVMLAGMRMIHMSMLCVTRQTYSSRSSSMRWNTRRSNSLRRYSSGCRILR